jgi:hypothetical protein
MTNPINTEIRPEVQDVLGSLKRKIRVYVCVEGIALMLVVLELLFWFSFSIDWLWFLTTKFELAEWFRVGFDLFALGVLAVSLCYWIVFRLIRKMHSRSLALVLERRFPGLNDRLVTSVELAESITGDESPLTVSMLNRTVDAATEDASRLHVADVFEIAPVRWAIIGAMMAIISVVGYGLVDGADLNRWMKAYIGIEEEYWERETHLNLQVISEPNDRIREFKEDDENQLVYKHPKEGDLTLLITVPKGDNPKGAPFVVPETVDIEYRSEDGGGTKTATCTKVGKRSFRISFGSIISDTKLWVVGGDYKNRKPYQIKVVDPPQTVEMNLNCEYPLYTGMNSDDTVEKLVQILGKDVSLPVETRFVLNVKTNKSLLDASLEFGRFQLKFGQIPVLVSTDEQTGRITYKRVFRAHLQSKGLGKLEQELLAAAVGPGIDASDENQTFVFPIPQETAEQYFSANDKGFYIPFIISDLSNETTNAKLMKEFKEDGLGYPFLMHPGSDVRLSLEDTDEIAKADPGKLTVNVIEDTAPEIEAERRDIGIAVTSEASIPVYAKILDDYGLADVRFEYRVAPNEKTPPGPWRAWSNLENPVISDDLEPKDVTPADRPKQFFLHREVAIGSITDVNVEDNIFTLAGNQLGELYRNNRIRVSGSTGNNQAWGIKSITFDGSTHIVVDGNITSGVADGQIFKLHQTELFQVSEANVPETSPTNKNEIQFRSLRPGDILTLAVRAVDGDNLNGPHITRSLPELRFRIVTKDELHYILYGKETSLRTRFEQIIKEVQETRNDFETSKKESTEVGTLSATKKTDAVREKINDLVAVLKLTADRGKAQLSKNRNETQQIEQGFRGIRAELVNNKLFTAKQAQRMDVDIIQKLDIINNDDYPGIDKAIANYRKKMDNRDDPTDAIQDCVDRINLMLVHMDVVLDKMEKIQKIGAVIRSLDELIKSQRELAEKTRKQQELEALRKLKELQKLQNP